MTSMIHRIIGRFIRPMGRGRASRPQSSHSSGTESYLVCAETGVHRPILHRYIKKSLGLSPDQYRKKWGLPSDYPMVSNAYQRRRLAAQKMENFE